MRYFMYRDYFFVYSCSEFFFFSFCSFCPVRVPTAVNPHTLIQKEIPKPESGKSSSEIFKKNKTTKNSSLICQVLHHCFLSFFLLSVLFPVDVETAGRLKGWTTTLPLAPHCRVNLSGLRGCPESSLSRAKTSLVSCFICWPHSPHSLGCKLFLSQ